MIADDGLFHSGNNRRPASISLREVLTEQALYSRQILLSLLERYTGLKPADAGIEPRLASLHKSLIQLGC